LLKAVVVIDKKMNYLKLLCAERKDREAMLVQMQRRERERERELLTNDNNDEMKE
jgi:hypothetical protein